MLDIRYVMQNPDEIKQDLKKRNSKEKVPLVEELIKKHEQYKALKEENEKIRQSRNSVTREINELRKQGKDIKDKLKQAKQIPQKLAESDQKLAMIEKRINEILDVLPNILHESVPVGEDESENVEVKRWGTARKKDVKSHGDLLDELNLAEFNKAAKVSGAGFYFLKGDLLKLEQALIRFALDELEKKGFTSISVPLMLRKDAYKGVVALNEFEDVMYKIADEDSYLIATSEHIIAAMHADDVFEEKDLPLKYAGFSQCFRKEIGSHGVDTRGLFRVHQFNKVEMFVFCKPEESWRIHEQLLQINEEMIKKLKIPYRVVNICTGDIGTIAAKKYDVEAWYPRQDKYGEIISTSNCTSYQAVAKNIRYKKGEEKEYVHTLNSTAIATTRILVAIVENFQKEDGTIEVPQILQKYVGKKVIGKR